MRPSDIRTAYRAILRREPFDQEVLQATLVTNVRSSKFHFYRDMVESEEFQKQILPALVAQTVAQKTPNIFFLHVPKTGGTSLRELIGNLIGVPSINIYRRWPTPNKSDHSFWPYWAGHAQVSFFPEEHKGITFFREPKSRILSRYRQNQNRSLSASTHGWKFSKPEAPKSKSFPDFNRWLVRQHELGQLGLAKWFSLDERSQRLHKSHEELIKLSKMTETELEPFLVNGLNRFVSAARIEDEKAVKSAIQKATGISPDALPRKNTFESKTGEKSVQFINKKSLEILEEVEMLDERIMGLAREMGILHESEDLKDDSLFEINLERLGFQRISSQI